MKPLKRFEIKYWNSRNIFLTVHILSETETGAIVSFFLTLDVAKVKSVREVNEKGSTLLYDPILRQKFIIDSVE